MSQSKSKKRVRMIGNSTNRPRITSEYVWFHPWNNHGTAKLDVYVLDIYNSAYLIGDWLGRRKTFENGQKLSMFKSVYRHEAIARMQTFSGRSVTRNRQLAWRMALRKEILRWHQTHTTLWNFTVRDHGIMKPSRHESNSYRTRSCYCIMTDFTLDDYYIHING